MTKKSDLLQEAIADAKAVRELALENAKEALKEAFTPKLQSMLSAKIQQEMEDMDDKEELDDEEMDEGAGKTGEQTPDYTQAADESKVTSDFSVKEETELEEAAELNSSGIGNSDNKEPSKATHGDESSTEDEEGIHPGSSPAKENDFAGLEDSKYGMEESVDENAEAELDEELDLESIIKELEEDYDYMEDDYMDDEGEEGEEGEVDYGQEEPAVDYGIKPDASAPEMDGGGNGDEDGDIDIDIDLDDEDEDMYGEGKTVDERRESGYEDGHEEKLADIDEALASIKNAETIKELEQKVTNLEGQLKEKTTIVQEYYDGVKYLKEKLNEVNILNAKLLFTNKLFRTFNLDQRGKMRVIENFDRAQNVREIKLVFTTLAETLRSTQAVLQSKKQQVKRITEGASKVTQSTKPSEEAMKEENVLPDFVVRAQKLAGITK